MSSKIVINGDNLAKSAQKFRKELLMMAIIALERSSQHMTVRMGIQGKETVGELGGAAEFGPYDADRVDNDDITISPRELETFFGSVIKRFDPNKVLGSIYGTLANSGDALKNVPIEAQIVAFVMKQISKGLNKNLFSAKRNAAGTKSNDLFNGFDTIADTEITAGNIAVAKNNLYEFSTPIDRTNAVDQLIAYYRASTDELQDEKTKLFLPYSVYNAYNDSYLDTFGAVAYNKQFNKVFLEGTDNNCELVPLSNKKGSDFIQLTTKGNMLIGVDQMGNKEKVNVDRFEAFRLTLSAAMFFGTQYESISPERLLIGKLAKAE